MMTGHPYVTSISSTSDSSVKKELRDALYRWSVDAQNDEGPATDEKPEAQSFERRQSWQPDGDRSGSANRIGSARICNFFAVRTN